MRRVVSYIIIVSVILGVLSGVAYADDDGDFRTFTQSDPRWADYVWEGSSSRHTIGSTGCMIVSITILIAYSDETRRDWHTFNPEICARDHLIFNSGGLASFSVYNIDGDPFLFCSSKHWSGDAGSAKEKIRQYMNDGLYIMVGGTRVTGSYHFSPVVGWDNENDKPILWDVYAGGDCWDSFASSGGTIQIVPYQSKLLSANETIYNSSFDPSGYTPSVESVKIQTRLKREWELTGMPKESDMMSSQTLVGVEDRMTWEYWQQQSSVALGDKINENKTTVYDVIRVAFVVFGILMFLYAVLLYLGYAFDRSNSFIYVSLLGLLTFGKLKVTEEELTKEREKEGYVTKRGLYIRICVILGVGVLLMSGILVEFIYRLYYLIV